MTGGASKSGDDEQTTGDEPVHVFDQTNGVLGPDTGGDRRRTTGATSPTAFGVPPIVSL